MKLCHIVPSLQEQHGGPSKSVRALCRALSEQGHAVELLTTSPEAPRDGEERREGGVTIRCFRRTWPQRLCAAPGLRAALSACEADVIHHHALWLRPLAYAHAQSRRRSIPLVISPRGMMSPWAWNHHALRKRVSRQLVHRGAFEHAAGWHATSAGEEAEIRALGFAQPVCVAPNGVDAPTAAEVGASAAFWRGECPEVTTRRTALFYGRLHQKKRVVELIDAWLEHAPREWLLLIVGLPEDYTPDALERYVARQSAAGRVRAFAGAGRPAPYAVASLFLLPSHSENFGLTIAEAMANGVPALVTDTTPWQGLNRGERGWCVPWSEYGDALRRATGESPAALRARGGRARAWVLEEFSWSGAARQLSAFYASLARGPA